MRPPVLTRLCISFISSLFAMIVAILICYFHYSHFNFRSFFMMGLIFYTPLLFIIAAGSREFNFPKSINAYFQSKNGFYFCFIAVILFLIIPFEKFMNDDIVLVIAIAIAYAIEHFMYSILLKVLRMV
jgi:hypothetical protein